MFWGKKPLLEELFLELLESDVQVTHALDAELRTVELVRAVAREHADAAKGDDLHAVFRRKRSFPAMPRNITHLSALPSSLSVK